MFLLLHNHDQFDLRQPFGSVAWYEFLQSLNMHQVAFDLQISHVRPRLDCRICTS